MKNLFCSPKASGFGKIQVSSDTEQMALKYACPRRSLKGKSLLPLKKQENKRISGIRIKVEHAIGGMKKCRIVKERFRCHKFGFEDMVILIACGLHNFRISHKMSRIISVPLKSGQININQTIPGKGKN